MSDVKPGRREIYAAQTRAAVLDAAQKLFVQKGFDVTSVEDIASLANASKGTVYHHFSDKREIFAEVLRTSEVVVMQAAIEAMSTSDPLWENFEAASRTYIQTYVADDAARALLRQAISVLGWGRVRALDEEITLPFLRTALQQCVASGEVRAIPIDATADTIIGLYCNAILYIANSADPETAARDMDAVVISLLSGLRAK